MMLDNRTQMNKQVRVAAYCRVSTKLEEQEGSYELQVNYYTKKIRQKQNVCERRFRWHPKDASIRKSSLPSTKWSAGTEPV